MILPLTTENYQLILKMYKSTKDKREANYLNLILLKHKGYSQIEIADILHLDANTISTWVRKFETSETIEQYLRLNYQPYLGKLSYYHLGKVDNMVENSTFSDTKPIISEIKRLFGVEYSNSGIIKLLTRLGFSHKQKVALPSKLDVKKQSDFIAKYEEINNNLGENSAIFLWMRYILNIIPIP